MLNDFNGVTALVMPIEFPCVVHGKKLTARITHKQDFPVVMAYHIRFSDGYETVVSCSEADAPDNWWDTNGKYMNTPYAQVIAADLDTVSTSFDYPDDEVHVIIVDFENDPDVNVWAIQDEEDKNQYFIYWNGIYHFTAQRTGESWNFYSVRVINPEPINMGLAHYIAKQINVKSANHSPQDRQM